jgi:hypothetical protein
MMPIRMRRKARGMEKVENLYCTARAQHVMPRRRDHAVESGGANRFKPSRPGCPHRLPICAKGNPNRGRNTLALNPHWPRRGGRRAMRRLRGEEPGCPGGLPRRPCRTAARGQQPGSPSRSLSKLQPCRPLVRYESIPRGTLRILLRYCSDRTELARRSLKFDRYPAKLLAMQRAAP